MTFWYLGVVLIWFLRDTNVVFVGKRCYSGLFDILSASFHGNTRLDAKLQIEGAFWFLHHHNYPFLSDIEAGSIRRVDFADGKGSVLE